MNKKKVVKSYMHDLYPWDWKVTFECGHSTIIYANSSSANSGHGLHTPKPKTGRCFECVRNDEEGKEENH